MIPSDIGIASYFG